MALNRIVLDKILEYSFPENFQDETASIITPDMAGTYTTVTSLNVTSYELFKNDILATLPVTFAAGDDVRVVIVRPDIAKGSYLILT